MDSRYEWFFVLLLFLGLLEPFNVFELILYLSYTRFILFSKFLFGLIFMACIRKAIIFSFSLAFYPVI